MADPSPASVRICGWIPRASSRKLGQGGAGLLGCLIETAPDLGIPIVAELEPARRSASVSDTSRCWAPSWRSRSTRFRSASPASTIRARDSRTSRAGPRPRPAGDRSRPIAGRRWPPTRRARDRRADLVVEDGRDRLAVALQEGHRPSQVGGRQHRGRRPRPGSRGLLRPVRDRQAAIAARSPARRGGGPGRHLAQLDDEVGDGRAGHPACEGRPGSRSGSGPGQRLGDAGDEADVVRASKALRSSTPGSR